MFDGNQSVDLQAVKFTKFQYFKSAVAKVCDPINGKEIFLALAKLLLGEIPPIKNIANTNELCTFLGCGTKKELSMEEFLLAGVIGNGSVLESYEKMCTMKHVFTVRKHKPFAMRKNCYIIETNVKIFALQSFYVLFTDDLFETPKSLIFSKQLVYSILSFLITLSPKLLTFVILAI